MKDTNELTLIFQKKVPCNKAYEVVHTNGLISGSHDHGLFDWNCRTSTDFCIMIFSTANSRNVILEFSQSDNIDDG